MLCSLVVQPCSLVSEFIALHFSVTDIHQDILTVMSLLRGEPCLRLVLGHWLDFRHRRSCDFVQTDALRKILSSIPTFLHATRVQTQGNASAINAEKYLQR